MSMTNEEITEAQLAVDNKLPQQLATAHTGSTGPQARVAERHFSGTGLLKTTTTGARQEGTLVEFLGCEV